MPLTAMLAFFPARVSSSGLQWIHVPLSVPFPLLWWHLVCDKLSKISHFRMNRESLGTGKSVVRDELVSWRHVRHDPHAGALWFIYILKTVHLQQLKGMQSSKLGLWKEYHLSIEGMRKRYPSCQGLDLREEPPRIIHYGVPPTLSSHLASRGFSLAWLLAFTKSFAWPVFRVVSSTDKPRERLRKLTAMQERNLCSQGTPSRYWSAF